MRFEEYLIESCAVSPQQITRAIDIRRESRPPIGSLAVEQEVLTTDQVDLVLAAQDQYVGHRFGELAVDLGLISEGALDDLLALQRERSPSLADVLVDMGVVDPMVRTLVSEWYATENAPKVDDRHPAT